MHTKLDGDSPNGMLILPDLTRLLTLTSSVHLFFTPEVTHCRRTIALDRYCFSRERFLNGYSPSESFRLILSDNSTPLQWRYTFQLCATDENALDLVVFAGRHWQRLISNPKISKSIRQIFPIVILHSSLK